MIDSGNPDVRVKIGIPIGIKVIYLRRFNLRFSSSKTIPASILESDNDMLSLLVGDSEIPIIHLVKYLWEEANSISREVGNYEYIPPKQNKKILLTEGTNRVELDYFSIIYLVEAN